MAAGFDPARLQRVQDFINNEVPENMRSKVLAKVRDELRNNDLFMDQFARDPAVEPREDLTFLNRTPLPGMINPEWMDTARQNLPFSAAELGREWEGVARNVPELLKTLAGIAVDIPTAPASALGLDRIKPGQGGQMEFVSDPPNRAVEFGKGAYRSIFDPQESARHPLGALSGLASLFQPWIKAPAAAKVAGVLADPVTSAIGGTLKLSREAAKKAKLPEAVRAASELVGGVTTEVFGATTGEGGEAVRGLVESGVSSPKRAATARAQIKKGKERSIGTETIDSIKSDLDRLGEVKDKALKAARDVRIDMDGVKRRIFGEPIIGPDGNMTFRGGILEPVEGGPGIEIIPASPNEPGAFLLRLGESANAPKTAGGSTWVKTDLHLAEYLSDANATALSKLLARIASKNRTISPLELDNLKVRIDAMEGLKPQAGDFVTRIRSEIRGTLGAEVPGYNKPVGQMDELYKFISNAERETGTKLLTRGTKASGEARPTKVQKALKEGFLDEGEAVKEVVEGLDERYDLGLKDRIPARMMSTKRPKGLIAKSAASAGVSNLIRAGLAAALGGGATVAAGPLVGGLLMLGSVSPWVVGRAAIELGATTRQVSRLKDYTRDLLSKAKANGINVSKMGFAELIERTQNLEESQGEAGQLIRALNRIDASSIGGPSPSVR